MVSSAPRTVGLLHRALRASCLIVLASFLLAASGYSQAARSEATALRKSFKVAAGDAASSLKQFSQQSGEQLVFPVESVRGVKTNAINGELTAREALDRMLAGTGLTVVQDDRTGAFAIRRETDESKNVASRRELDAAALASGKPIELGTYEVTGSRLAQTEVEGISPVITFDRDFIVRSGFGTTEEFLRTLPQNFTGASAGRPGVPNDENPVLFARNAGQSGAGLRGLGSNNTLVLINGRRAPLSGRGNNGTNPPQGFFDLNTVPVGMIERIEVLTDGASAIYGTDAVGGVINIILKSGYNETEMRGRVAGTWHGGGFERGVTLTNGFTVGKLRGTVVLDWFQREPLFASQRPFSKNQDYRNRAGGTDQRSVIGNPITVYSLSGQFLNGLFNPDGSRATRAVGPMGVDGRNLTIADFAAGAGQVAAHNGAALYSLVTPTERMGASLNLEYALTQRISIFSELNFTNNKTDTLANAISTHNPNSSATLPRIPANNPFNPFGQILGFTLSHEELGPRHLVSNTDGIRALLGASLRISDSWTAEGSFMFFGQKLHTVNPLVDNAALTAALAETNPATALNLFSDFARAGAGNSNAAIYERIINNNIEDSRSDIYTSEFTARGPVWELPSGPVQFAFGGEWIQQDRIRTTNNPSTVLPARSRETRNSYAAYGEFAVPVVRNNKNRFLLRSFDLQLAARYEDIDNAGSTLDPKYGFRWKPFDQVMFRASYGTGYRAPALTELERPETDANQTITDRRRSDERYPVLVTMGSNPNLRPETSETINYGIIVNVPYVKGLSFGMDYYRKEQQNLTTNLTVQQVVDFEEFFGERIVRDASTGGQPGRILSIDQRFFNFGEVIADGFDFNANYMFTTQSFGRFNFRANASYLKSYKIAFNPGDPLVERKGTFGFPQSFKGNAYLFWDYRQFGVTFIAYHQGKFNRNNVWVPAWTTFDVNASYEWEKYNLRFQGGIGNIADREPHFVNSLWGYDGGFHNARMRTYNASVTYTF